MENNGKTSKPAIQKAYEKWAMLYKSIVQINNKDLPFDASPCMICGTDADGDVGVYIALACDDGSYIPVCKLLSHKELDIIEPDMGSMEPLTKMFYQALMTDKREKADEFNGFDGPEISAMTMEQFSELVDK